MNHTSTTTQSLKITSFILFGLLLIMHKPSYAKSSSLNDQWGQCSVKTLQNSQTTPRSASKIIEAPFPDAIYLEADDGTISLNETSLLKGNVIIQQKKTLRIFWNIFQLFLLNVFTFFYMFQKIL